MTQSPLAKLEEGLSDEARQVWVEYHRSLDLRPTRFSHLDDDELWRRAWSNRAEERRRANSKQ